MSKRIGILVLIALLCTSCQKKYNDQHTKDEVIIEFAARLEEYSSKYQYDHTKIPQSKSFKKKNNHAD